MAHAYQNSLRAATAAIALLAGMSTAIPGGFALRDQSTQGLGNAFAGAAAGGAGLGSMFWNPATMTGFGGLNTSSSFTLILPHAEVTAGPGTLPAFAALGAKSGDLGQGAFVPASYASYQYNEKLWLGVSVGAPYGLLTKADIPSAGQVYGRTSKVFSTEVTPTFAYKVNEFLSIGAGLRVMYFKVKLTNATAAVPVPPLARLVGDGYSVGYTFGATLRPGPNTEIGIGYRSRMRPTLEGTLEAPGIPGANGIKTAILLPDQISAGVRHQVSKDWTALAGFEWTHWGLFKSFPVISTGPFIAPGTQVANLAFQYKNSWYASLGAEYQWNPDLKLRAGLGYETPPVNDRVRTVRLPDSHRLWTTVGFTYNYSQKLSIDVSYAHLFIKSANVIIVAGNPAFPPVGAPYVGKARAYFDILSVGLNYRWDSPAPAVVAKY